MTPSDLTSRVSRDACVLGVALAGPAAYLGGLDGALGAAAGAGIALGNFRWLAARAQVTGGDGSPARSLWSLAAGLRLAAVVAALAVVVASGHAHPLAILAGVIVIPIAVIVHGLRGARERASGGAIEHPPVVRTQGVVTFIQPFMGPVWWLAPLLMPIELISHLARPLSLPLRLFGTMVGGHILLAVIFFLMGLNGLIGWALHGRVAGALVGGLSGVIGLVFTVGFLYPLKILVSFLQAFIFVMLTMLYIAGAIEHAEAGADCHAAAHHHSRHH